MSDDESNKKEVVSSTKSLKEQQKEKLFNLRMQLNECRKRNYQEVVAEDKRAQKGGDRNGDRDEATQNKRRAKPADGEEEKEEQENWRDNITVDEAEKLYKAKNKPKKESFGWEMFTEEAQFNAYKKRTKDLKLDQGAYQVQKAELSEQQVSIRSACVCVCADARVCECV
eukprot:TRINITY_DN1874_c0_g1_i2.p1 TRINITY_DN1874_c0_g1~~TRINITY_DN1874_c0_g1_i2.p1  ORF type:complete len:170 (-),score=52.99 TRINITY_DN1874_c0_g1_i2:13-522(-)